MARRGVLIVIGVLVVALAIAVIGVRWALRPENLARVISGWVERELEAQLALSEPPGLRLVPRLELTLSGVRLESRNILLGTAGELRVALPWSMLWSGGVRIESLTVREPVIDWPQLRELLAGLSDDEPSSPSAPRLPEIAVGVRVEDGVLHAGSDAPAWRIDRISLVTTPLHEGESFHLDAGARLVGTQSRTLSLTVSARPVSSPDALALEDISLRTVVSPDARPLADGIALSLAGSMRLSGNGLAALALGGDVPGWPEWLPAALGFAAGQPVAIEATLPDGGEWLSLLLRQSGHEAAAWVHVGDIAAAMERLDRPLAALASVRSRWRIDAITAGGVRAEGIRIGIGEPATVPDAGAVDTDTDAGVGSTGAVPAERTTDRDATTGRDARRSDDDVSGAGTGTPVAHAPRGGDAR